MVNPHIFRQYDIRGVVGDDVTVPVAEAIGRGFATLVRRPQGLRQVTNSRAHARQLRDEAAGRV